MPIILRRRKTGLKATAGNAGQGLKLVCIAFGGEPINAAIQGFEHRGLCWIVASINWA